MINLLPTEIKREIGFAKLNARLIRYIWLTGGVAVVLAVMFGGALLYLHVVGASTAKDLAGSQASIAQYAQFSKEAAAVSQRLTAIKVISAGQTHFSLLLSDLAKVLPDGTALSGIVLTGDATKPVQLSVTAGSYDQALAVRDAVATSPRIAGADLVSITSQDGVYTAAIIIAFAPGAAR